MLTYRIVDSDRDGSRGLGGTSGTTGTYGTTGGRDTTGIGSTGGHQTGAHGSGYDAGAGTGIGTGIGSGLGSDIGHGTGTGTSGGHGLTGHSQDTGLGQSGLHTPPGGHRAGDGHPEDILHPGPHVTDTAKKLDPHIN